MLFCDTHCHLDLDYYETDREEVIDRACQSQVKMMINAGIDMASSRFSIDLARRFPGVIFAAIGFHPNDCAGIKTTDLLELRELATQPGVVAIGEIGLDYYRDYTPRDKQRTTFERQLTLAAEFDLPVIIHDREATADLLPILKNWASSLSETLRIKSLPGVLHAFADSAETAEEMAAYGFMFGIGGPVTYPNARARREIIARLPLDRLLLETDAPFLTPQAHRGHRNEPAYIPLIAEQVAVCLNLPLDTIADATTSNARRLFRI